MQHSHPSHPATPLPLSQCHVSRAVPALMRSPILLRLMRNPAEATASRRRLASTLDSSSTRGARTCGVARGVQVGCWVQEVVGLQRVAGCKVFQGCDACKRWAGGCKEAKKRCRHMAAALATAAGGGARLQLGQADGLRLHRHGADLHMWGTTQQAMPALSPAVRMNRLPKHLAFAPPWGPGGLYSIPATHPGHPKPSQRPLSPGPP